MMMILLFLQLQPTCHKTYASQYLRRIDNHLQENVAGLVSLVSKYLLHSSYLLSVGSCAMVHDSWQCRTHKSLKWKNDIIVYMCPITFFLLIVDRFMGHGSMPHGSAKPTNHSNAKMTLLSICATPHIGKDIKSTRLGNMLTHIYPLS